MVDQDLAVADVARTAGCSTLVVLSKWDIAEVGIEDVRERLATRLRQRSLTSAALLVIAANAVVFLALARPRGREAP